MIGFATPADSLKEISHIARAAPAALSTEAKTASIEMFLAVLEGDAHNLQLAADALAFHAGQDLIDALRAKDSKLADMIENSRCYVRIH